MLLEVKNLSVKIKKTGKEIVKSMIEQVYAVKIPAGTTIYTEPVGY